MESGSCPARISGLGAQVSNILTIIDAPGPCYCKHKFAVKPFNRPGDELRRVK